MSQEDLSLPTRRPKAREANVISVVQRPQIRIEKYQSIPRFPKTKEPTARWRSAAAGDEADCLDVEAAIGQSVRNTVNVAVVEAQISKSKIWAWGFVAEAHLQTGLLVVEIKNRNFTGRIGNFNLSREMDV